LVALPPYCVAALWQSILQYIGIALAALVVIAIIGFIIYKRLNKDKVQVIMVKETDDDDDDDDFHVPAPGAPPMAAQMQPRARAPFGGPGMFGPRAPFGAGAPPRFPGARPGGP